MIIHLSFYRVFINYKLINDCRPIAVSSNGSQPMRSSFLRKNDACVHNHGSVPVREYRVHIDLLNFRCRIDEVRKFQKHLLQVTNIGRFLAAIAFQQFLALDFVDHILGVGLFDRYDAEGDILQYFHEYTAHWGL